jgi:hypothetical protein
MNSSRSKDDRTVYDVDMMDDCEEYKDQWTLSRYQRRVSPSPELTAAYYDDASNYDFCITYPGGVVGLALGGKM